MEGVLEAVPVADIVAIDEIVVDASVTESLFMLVTSSIVEFRAASTIAETVGAEKEATFSKTTVGISENPEVISEAAAMTSENMLVRVSVAVGLRPKSPSEVVDGGVRSRSILE